MALEQEPFVKYNLDKKEDTFTVKLNEEERAELEQVKKAIEQTKDSTALKQAAKVGAKVILSRETGLLLAVILNNRRKNKRLGIADFD